MCCIKDKDSLGGFYMEEKYKDSVLYVENLTIKFPDLDVAENESFYVSPGEIVLILGDNGVGKSSVLKALVNAPDIRKYSSRNLYFMGNKIEDGNIDFFRRSIGYAMQEDDEDPLFTRKVIDYIGSYAASAIDTKNYKEYYPKLFNEYLKCNSYDNGKLNQKRLKICSGGQKRMVSLLRAFSRNNANLYILDEPINNLDSKHARILNNFLLDLKKRKSPPGILIVTHCHMFQGVDRAYQIKNGKLRQLEKYEPKSCFGECDECGYYKEEK